MKKGLKILMVFMLAGALLVGGAVYTILSKKINLSSLDLISTAFADEVLMCNEIGNGVQFRLLGPGIIEEVLERLGLDETELKNSWDNGQTLLDFALSKDITKEKLIQTFRDVITEKLNELVKEGKISETEKENFLLNLDTRIEDFITKTPPFRKGLGVGRGNPPIDNRGKPPIDKTPGEPPVDKRLISSGLGLMEEVLNRLNLSVDEFRSAVKDGKSLLEFAQSKGITKDELITVVKEVVIQKINQLVSDGKITEEQKAKFLANLDDFVEKFINVPGKRGPNGGRRGMSGFNKFPNIEN